MAFSLLNSIFYNGTQYNVEPTLCEPYMMFDDYIKSIAPKIVNNIEILEKNLEEPVKEEPRSQLFSPKKEDKLFWSIYVLNIGEAEYYMIGNKYKNVEMEEKKTILDYILKNRAHIKSLAKNNGFKITNVKMQLVESELMVDRKTSWLGFWIMCLYYNINAIIVQDKIYMEFNVDSHYNTYLFEKNEDFHMNVDCIKLTNERLNTIKKNRLRIDPFVEKILKGVSTYKTSELETMMQILNIYIDNESKPKKNDYYETIIKKLVTLNIQN
jgi:hypothetical protein